MGVFHNPGQPTLAFTARNDEKTNCRRSGIDLIEEFLSPIGQCLPPLPFERRPNTGSFANCPHTFGYFPQAITWLAISIQRRNCGTQRFSRSRQPCFCTLGLIDFLEQIRVITLEVLPVASKGLD